MQRPLGYVEIGEMCLDVACLLLIKNCAVYCAGIRDREEEEEEAAAAACGRIHGGKATAFLSAKEDLRYSLHSQMWRSDIFH